MPCMKPNWKGQEEQMCSHTKEQFDKITGNKEKAKELVTLKELDKLAGKFIIGHKRLSSRQVEILKRIGELEIQQNVLDNRKVRIKNLIEILYKELR